MEFIINLNCAEKSGSLPEKKTSWTKGKKKIDKIICQSDYCLIECLYCKTMDSDF